MKKFGVYIHIPFCKQACYYCNFHFSTNLKLKEQVLAAIIKELSLQKSYLGNASVSSIYFGGGTPSILSSDEVEILFTHITKNFYCQSDIEVTLELNPDDACFVKLKDLKKLGINRLSVGIQSFQEHALKYLNRAHDASQALACVDIARKAGFDNLSIDLIYANPVMDKILWQKDLDIAMSLSPEHISAYCLTIEKKTVFGNWLQHGKMQEVSECNVVEQYKMLLETLNRHDYIHYEVSNFAKKNRSAIHNSNYWNHSCGYLGVGPGAHSYNGVSRQSNVSNNFFYIKSLAEDKVPFNIEFLTKRDLINEYIMTSLRTNIGCDLHWLRETYNYDLLQLFPAKINELLANNLCQVIDKKMILTPMGLLLADGIAKNFFML